jgi:shikimate kinase
MGKKLIFIGYMGSGKSTVARRLAEMTPWKMADIDREVEKQSGMTIPNVFRKQGETTFRSWENRVLQSVLSDESIAIIACGGGLPCSEENWTLLRECGGRVIWLDPPFATIYKRLQNETGRPLLLGPSGLKSEVEIRAHFEKRRACYEKADERMEDPVDDQQLVRWADWLAK